MKNKFKKILVLVFVLIFTIGLEPVSLATNDNINLTIYDAKVASMFAANVETGEIYYERNADKALGIASTSKLMTYLVVKDEISQGKYRPEDTIKINKDIASFAKPGYSRMELKIGEIISVEDLLKGLMVVSGNDAAIALAVKSSGSERAFVEKMNSKAKELGLKTAIFVNSTGLTDEKKVAEKIIKNYNVMSAKDMFKLSQHIVKKYPEVEEYSKMKDLSMPERNFYGQKTHNIGTLVTGLLGLKTGTTDEAGNCFIGYVDMDQFEPGQKYRIITVVYGADSKKTRKKATADLVNYVNSSYRYRDLLSYKEQRPVVDYIAKGSRERSFPLYFEKSLEGIFTKDSKVDISYEIYEGKEAPYEDGQVLGEANITYKGKEFGKVNLVNRGYKPRLNGFSLFFERISKFLSDILLLF